MPSARRIQPLQQSPGGRLVILNGFPGAGKYTILKRVHDLLPADITCLLDNHLLIDPVTAVIPDRSDDHYKLRQSIRAPIFRALRKRAQEGHTILMTTCLAKENERDVAAMQEHLDIVRKTDIPIFWINIHCELAILEQRVANPERCREGKTKLTDVGILRDLVRKHQLIEPLPSEEGLTRLFVETLDSSGPVELSVGRLMSLIDCSQNVNGNGGEVERNGGQGSDRDQQKVTHSSFKFQPTSP